MDFPDKDVTKVNRIAMALELDRSLRKDGSRAVPVVPQDDIINHQWVVEMYSNSFTHCFGTEGVPLADRFVCDNRGLARVLFIVIESPGADLVEFRIPDLDLRAAAQIDASPTQELI